MTLQPWTGKRALIVEDELLIVMMLEDLLEYLGCRVVMTATQLDAAIVAATTGEFDFAIVDLNLAGKSSSPVVEILRSRAMPFVIATGTGAIDLPPDLRETPLLSKPFTENQLKTVLNILFR